jgi:hypothetical protein
VSTPLGPFVVEPDQIVRLGASFTVFVNRLLDLETSAAGQLGVQLRTNYWENVPDGGVDAEVSDASGSRWVPDGNSAWQFKRGDLAPQGCRDELAGRRRETKRSVQPNATWARALIAGGSKYRLVLGVPLTARQIKNRRDALYAEAGELGLPAVEDTFEVLDANMLARWASDYPSLAVSRLLRGPGQLAVDFETWSSSNRHQTLWVAAPDREALMSNLRAAVSDRTTSDLRLDGVSGIGKTRLVMEALRGNPLSDLVTYIGDAEKMNPEFVNHLLAHGRSAVVIVDECTGRRHEKLAEVIPAASSVKLLTIGEPDSYAIRAPLVRLPGLSEDVLDSILKGNWPQLWPEARRWATTQSDGNVRLALLLGERILREPPASANALIQSSDISGLLTNSITGGGDFLAAAVLALLRRVGWEGDLSYQIELLAGGTGIPLEQLRNVGRTLEQQGLLVRQGRYRSVSPHPVAVFLAAHAWRELSERLIQDLLPELDEELAYNFFSRAADLGEFEPARTAIARLLDADGPFGTLDAIEARGSGKSLTQIAIVAPDETSTHLTRLIQASTTDHLLSLHQSRRDLVWTLEKLAWHSRTFNEAADDLLSLALAENETWSNNATGTWVDLFGSMLPGTSARPGQRADYLRRVSASADAEIRKLAIGAAAHGLERPESIAVSGELQAGVLVEPRGTPATYEEAFDYQKAMISIMAGMLTDADLQIVEEAESALVRTIHAALELPPIREPLIEALLQMRPAGLQKVRTEVEHLSALFERVDGVERRIEGLRALTERLPPGSPADELDVLVDLRRWDFAEGELQTRIEAAVRTLEGTEREHVLELLSRNPPAAWELGRAIAVAWERSDELMETLANLATTSLPALVGYLWGLHDQGDLDAYDDFLESEMAASLAPDVRIAIAVRGPATDRGITRVLAELRDLSPAHGAAAMFGWHRSLSPEYALPLFDDWVGRIASQRDYNAVVDFAIMVLHDTEDIWEPLKNTAYSLVMKRGQYPDIEREQWAWARLAERFLPEHAIEISSLLFDVIESSPAMVHEESEDSALLLRCAAVDPGAVWDELARRLEAQSWRLELGVRGWLIRAFPAEVVGAWIGTDVGRGRMVASVAAAGEAEPTDVARILLDRFGADSEVASSLAGDFISGVWTGEESAHLTDQIKQLEGWVSRTTEPQGARNWARTMIRSLEVRRIAAMQREAEGNY